MILSLGCKTMSLSGAPITTLVRSTLSSLSSPSASTSLLMARQRVPVSLRALANSSENREPFSAYLKIHIENDYNFEKCFCVLKKIFADLLQTDCVSLISSTLTLSFSV